MYEMPDGFKVVSFMPGLPSVSITKNGITFSKTAVLKLKKAEWALLLMNEEQNLLAVRPCNRDEIGATRFFKERKNDAITVRWNNRDFLHTIEKMMDWNLADSGHKIDGEYISSGDYLLFDLKKAENIN